MLAPGEMVFLLDVDNSLLDNDRFVADLGERLEQAHSRRYADYGIRASGHYALEASNMVINPAPDLNIQRIGELLDFDLSYCLPGAAPTCAANLQQE